MAIDPDRAEIDDNYGHAVTIPKTAGATRKAFQWGIKAMGKLLEWIEQLPEQPGVKFYLLPRL